MPNIEEALKLARVIVERCDKGGLASASISSLDETLCRALIELAGAVEKVPHAEDCRSHRRTCSICGIHDESHAFFKDGRANPCSGGIYEQKQRCNCFKSALGVKP